MPALRFRAEIAERCHRGFGRSAFGLRKRESDALLDFAR